MKLGIIGDGAIGRYARDKAVEHGHEITALLLRPDRVAESSGELRVSAVADLPTETEHVVDCAGHSALRAYGAYILRGGIDLTTVSIGALADQDLLDELEQAAAAGGSKLRLASGAIGALDCLRAGRVGSLTNVTYIGRKPPQSWKGSPAESRIDLDALSSGAATHFSGSAGEAATLYPKNANVAAAVALAGIGFDRTQVQLIADADVTENIHEIEAAGEFGSFSFAIRGHSLADNPRSSALAAMSVVSSLEQASQNIIF